MYNDVFEIVYAFLFGLLVATILSASVLFYSTPSINCPQEDSCYADYYDGAWHILVTN